MKALDPTVVRLIESLRVALASFDADDACAPDRHADGCPCEICEFVRGSRKLVADYDAALGSPATRS